MKATRPGTSARVVMIFVIIAIFCLNSSFAATATNEAPPSGKTGYLPIEIVKADFELGKKHLAAGNPDIARLFFRNAVALERLAEKDPEGKRAEAMQKFVEQSTTPDRTERFTCPVCEGKPNPTTRFDDLRGSTRGQNKECPRCIKQTYIEKPDTIAQWRKRLESAKKEYAQAQARRGLVELAGAWLPGEWKDRVSAEQQAVLAEMLPMPCPECAGTGTVDCRLCQGIGEIKCPQCELGLVQDGERKLLKTTVVMLSKCSVCKGIGGGFCPKCDGKGRLPCPKCSAGKKR